jgi:type II secretory pathway component PulK
LACSTARDGQRGFVLAVTLWVLAGIAVVVGLVTLWSLDAVRAAAGERQRTEDEIAILGARDTLLYVGATRPQTLAGLPGEALPEDARQLQLLDDFGAFRRDPRGGELRLDGEAYAAAGGVEFAIQDEAGLFSLVLPAPLDLDRFLAAEGVKADDVPRLRDALMDYVDADSLRRLNGAESKEYERAHLPPPPNRKLLLPEEIRRVMGWPALPRSLLDRLPEATTTFYGGAVNLNTIPAALLPVWLPGCPETCKAFVARRQKQPFRSYREVEALFGVTLPGDEAIAYRTVGSDTLRFTLWGRSGAAWRIHVRFTPLADQRAPWSILAAYPVQRLTDHVPAQPTGSDLFADAPTGRP